MIDVCVTVPYVKVLHLEGNRLEVLPAAVGDLARLEAGAYTRSLFSST